MKDLEQHKKIAVLIDADNAQLTKLPLIIEELSSHGHVVVKRAYGDWSIDSLKNWKTVLNELAIQPIQQFAYTKGKNATDASMIIDAMDLLYSSKFDAFALVSSDSDFTRLASRIREAGLTVYGFGERKTPTAFVSACDKFIYVDVLSAPELDDDEDAPPKRKDSASLKRDARLVRLFRDALDANGDDEGWASLGAVGSHIANQAPDFDPRNYGYKKLGELAKALGVLEVDVQTVGATGQKAIRIRTKRRKSR